jgi:hypothetical protein
MKRVSRLVVLAVMAVAAPVLASGASATTSGTWVAYPGQKTVYKTEVKQPINADGTSVFGSNNISNSVIPVKFGLLSGLGSFVFESIYTDGIDPDPNTTDDYSFLSFTPSGTLTFNDIANLTASYAFTLGNCHGGSLRWSVRVDVGNDGNTANDGSVFIYYGAYPNFTDCTSPDAPPSVVPAVCGDTNTGDTTQTGENMIGRPPCRYDTSQFVGGTFYDSYADAQSLVGTDRVIRASLVLDSGWGGDQRLTLGSATVNDNTFTPQSPTPLKSTCDLPPADIRVTKVSGEVPLGVVNEPISIQPADVDGHFRIVDCKYMYNLATSSLPGPGRYKVEAVINGEAADGAAYFYLK